jgi:hypothetical protein
MFGFFDTRSLLRFIIGFMWPLPGYGIATTWLVMIGGTSFRFGGSMEMEIIYVECFGE